MVEIASIGPGPFCGMMLADMGADVLRVDRKTAEGTGSKYNVMARGRRAIGVDLKSPEGIEVTLRLVAEADALIEGFRPGVLERLGLGPEACLARNPRLVYGRITGWGQTGPLSQAAGHDINYISLTGALHSIGRPGEKPVPPLNLVGDFGGGGMMLAFGIVCALLEAKGSGEGQVIDAAMTDGAALLMAPIYGLKAAGRWTNKRGANLLDGGAHYYDTYECADGKSISIGSIEPQFYKLLLETTGLDAARFEPQLDPRRWADWKKGVAEVFRTRTRDEWCALMEGTDICFAPVLDMDEAPAHAHNVSRETFIEVDGVTQPAPAPRFSRTPAGKPAGPRVVGDGAEDALAAWGFGADEIADLRAKGVV